MISDFAKALLWILEVGLAGLVGYLLLLTVCALFAPRHTLPRTGPPDRKFLILTPAHDEEKLLPELLDSLAALDYPRNLIEVHVVADNCTDRTAEIARARGATAYERTDPNLRGKGYALNWLLDKLRPRLSAPVAQNLAFVILDADSLVSPDFLTVMDARLARGERVIQAYSAVRDPDRSWTVSLRYAALAVLHYLRPQGRMVLGASAGLKGNGMVFAADIVVQHAWSASLVEDIEYHMALILDGERVMFAPDAVVLAEMPGTLAASQSQNVRWERGRLEMLRAYVPRLLREAVRRRSFVLFDAAIEQLIPPTSVLAGASILAGIAALLLRARGAAFLAGGLVAGQLVYTLAGLLLVRAPRRVYLALIYAPALVAWKIWLYVRVLLGRDRQGWVRTPRD
jgi:cellulose synthase/poly-beta-1,6-N-acetylglucosamine synthase-like glycosyltransferase